MIMKNKKKLFIIIGGVWVLAAAAVLLYFFVFKKDNKPVAKPQDCENISGGGYNLVFKSEGKEIQKMHVCIACSPDSYEDLITPEKDGYAFDGWFYDEDLKDMVTVSNSLEIEPITKKDKNNCIEGYEDITLYAKWSKASDKTIKVIFDANGGSKVSTIEFKCSADNSATISKLPKSKRSGYTFVAWKDKNEKPISNGAKITCDNDLKLKATWEKESKPADPTPKDPAPAKKVSYKCEDGWTLDGTNCTRSVKARGSLQCNSDETLIDKMCVKIKTTTDEQMKSYTVKVCKKETIYDNYGSTREYDGVLFPDGVTCYYKPENETKESCLSKGYAWNSNDNKCYYATRRNNTTISCKGTKYYYVAKPNDYEGINGKNSGCYPTRAATEECPSGYTKIASHNSTISCIKTETKAATKVEE